MASPLTWEGAVQEATICAGLAFEVRLKLAGAEGRFANVTVLEAESLLSPI